MTPEQEQRIDKMIETVMDITKGQNNASFQLSGENDHLDALALGLNVLLDELKTTEKRNKKFLTSLTRKNAQLQQASHALEQSERYHRIFFEKSEGFLCTHDLQGNLLTVNKAGAKSIQYTVPELIGKCLRDILAPQIQGQFNDYLKKIITERSAKGLMYVITKNGQIRIWHYHNYLHEGSKESYVIGSAQDITERIQMEEELRTAKKKAEESERIKEQFLANTSHEIRTPMNAIIGFTDLLFNTPLNDDQKEYLTVISQAGKNLLEIINDILDLSKINAGKINIEKIDFSISHTISSSLSLFTTQAKAKGIELIHNIDPNIPDAIKGDPVRLKQILINLLSNAMKFTESGTIKLNVCLAEGENKFIKFSVEDSGIGIPEDKLGSIFESFTQATSDTSRRYGGTGLGLTIVKNLIELQGGTITAQSELGKGTQFIFALPLEEGTLEPKQISISSNKKQNLKNVRVLLVEDNKVNQRLAQIVLYKMQCEIDTADNGLKAIEKLKNSSYDVILMDVQMPEMDGYEATKYIRTQLTGHASTTPIIAMTAHALSDETNKCIEAGMNDYISKPFNPDILYNKIYHHTLSSAKSKTDERIVITEEEKPAYVNIENIKVAVGGDETVLKEMIDLLCLHIPKMIEELSIAGKAQNWDMVKKAAHKLKPTIAILRIAELQEKIESIEGSAGKKINTALIPGTIEKVVTITNSVLDELKAESKKNTKQNV